LITGATAGIGMATARLFAERDATLLLTGRNAAAGETLAAELGVQFLAADMTNADTPARLLAWAERIYGRLDILVNNAGILFQGDSQTCTDAQWDSTMMVNVTSVFRLSRAAVPLMARHGGGAIINVASDWGLVAAAQAVA